MSGVCLEYQDLRGYNEFTTLYESWKRFKQKGILSAQWDDFRSFFGWAMRNGYKVGVRVCRTNKKHSASPMNCYLVFPPGEGTAYTKGGSENSPCNGCYHNAPHGCVCYRECRRYTKWLNKCWEDFRKAAELRRTNNG